MSIYCSWEEIGESPDNWGEFTREVLTYEGSHVYPEPDKQRPATIGISHIPGFVWREHLPESRKDQDADGPLAPYLRVDIAAWSDEENRPMIDDGAQCVLTQAGALKLYHQLGDWLMRDKHDV
jgi:hypothetical protein